MKKDIFPILGLALFTLSCGGGGGGYNSTNTAEETGTLRVKVVFPENRFSFNDIQTVKINIEQCNNENCYSEDIELTPDSNNVERELQAGDVSGLITLWNNTDNCPFAGTTFYTYIYPGRTKKMTVYVENGTVELSPKFLTFEPTRVYIPSGVWELTEPLNGISKIQITPGNNCPENIEDPQTLTDFIKSTVLNYENGTEQPACWTHLEVQLAQTDGAFDICFKNGNNSCAQSEDKFSKCFRGEFINSNKVNLYWFNSINCTIKGYNETTDEFSLNGHACERQLPVYAFKNGSVSNNYYECNTSVEGDTVKGTCTYKNLDDTCVAFVDGKYQIVDCEDYPGATKVSEIVIKYTIKGYKKAQAQRK
jgi:hypothetical protein